MFILDIPRSAKSRQPRPPADELADSTTANHIKIRNRVVLAAKHLDSTKTLTKGFPLAYAISNASGDKVDGMRGDVGNIWS